MAIKRGIDRAVDVAVEEIKRLSRPVSGDMIAQVGRISANSDSTIGDVIAEAMKNVGLQLVIALVATADGFPLAYEVMNGNTSDRSTLRDFLQKIETAYGKARRVWVMDLALENLPKVVPPARHKAIERLRA
jgi:chaperonin GroEL (HSP60 family)